MQRLDVQRAGTEAVQATLRLTQSLLDQYPQRITGTATCLLAARQIADSLREHCDRVVEEPFELHPNGFWNVGKVTALAYTLSALLLIAGGPFAWGAAAICLLGLAYALTTYILCGSLFDRLFSPAMGCNVAGIIDPCNTIRQQVLIVGHHDAPYVLSFLLKNQRLAGVRLLLAMVAYLFLTILCLTTTVEQALGRADGPVRGTLLVLLLIGFALVLPLYGLITKTPSPGAGDNLNACAIAVQLAGLFAARGREGRPLQHTRLVLLSTDGEEVGQRGAIAYARRHCAELLATPTFVLNVDSVYRLRDLAVLVSDRHGTMPLSRQMAAECRELASSLGYAIKQIPLTPGSGGTDAAAFAHLGIAATTIIGIPATLFSSGLVYHTPYDTVERIEPVAVEAVLDIALNYVLSIDG